MYRMTIFGRFTDHHLLFLLTKQHVTCCNMCITKNGNNVQQCARRVLFDDENKELLIMAKLWALNCENVGS